MLTARILPPSEWPRLQGTEAEQLWPLVRKNEMHDDGDILVVERGNTIVGAWVVLRVAHVECLWIDPSERAGGTVARRLLQIMKQTVHRLGFGAVYTGAEDTAVQVMLERLGATLLPGHHYALPVRGRE